MRITPDRPHERAKTWAKSWIGVRPSPLHVQACVNLPDNFSATARTPLRTRSAKAEEKDPVTTAATVVVEELDAKGAIAPTCLDWRLFGFECGAPSHHLR